MPHFQGNDMTRLFYMDWGKGKPVLFCHSWAMSAKMWEYHMLYFSSMGMRCIAYDRRGHRGSDRPGVGYNYDQHSADLNSLIELLDLQDVTLVGHSMGGGEIIRYLTQFGYLRVSKLVLLAPTLPFLIKTVDNQEGLEPSLFEGFREDMLKDFPDWLVMGAAGFYKPETFGVSNATIDWTLNIMLQTSLNAVIEGNIENTQTDFRNELRKVTVPTLLIHGDDDLSVPVHFGRSTASLIPDCQYKEYSGAPHGLFFTHKELIAKDILSFLTN